MKRIIITTFLSICFYALYPQSIGNIWYFGYGAGIDFNVSPPVQISGQTTSFDNSATLSDANGNLLMYCDGNKVWNKNHDLMPNGSGLSGTFYSGQCALIVPQQESSIYYIFTVDQFAGPNGFRYSTVDMTLDGGLGDIVSKNNLLFAPSTEKIEAIYNNLDDSYWIITHTWNSSDFYCYKLSSSGLNVVPVISTVGSINANGYPYGYNGMGQLTISPDGTKLAITLYYDGIIELYDFNMSTGEISNPKKITGYPRALGAAFSPNSQVLYVSVWYSDQIYQFDLSSWVQSTISNSATLIGHATSTDWDGRQVGYLQLAPDYKIYAARFSMNKLAVISNPDNLGNACTFINDGIDLGSNTSSAGLSRSPYKHVSISSPTQITRINVPMDFKCFPNPTTGEVTLTIPKEYRENSIQISIKKLTGTLVYQNEFKGKTMLKLDLTKIPSGIYIMQTVNNQGLVNTKKLVINH